MRSVPLQVEEILLTGVREGGFNPLHLTAPKILDYLEHLASISLEHNSILTHLSALSSCPSLLEGLTVGLHPAMSARVKSH